MSERKSWDVQPSRAARPAAPRAQEAASTSRSAAPVRSAPRRAAQPVEITRKPSAPAAARAPQAPRRPAPPPQGTLRERRNKKRRSNRYVALVLLGIAVCGTLYALWLPALRVQAITSDGPNADVASAVVRMQLAGTYWHVIPRNSIFFAPKDSIRAAILDAVPSVSAVSISRASFSSIAITTTPRAATFLWCGTSIDVPLSDGSCYSADAEGLLFQKEAVDQTTTSSTTTRGPVRVYAALDRELKEGQPPLRSRIASTSKIPDAIKFVDAVRQLGVEADALSIRGDEADIWVAGRTRITYVLGREEDAAALAASALPELSFTDGRLQYVDLRFPGKAYIGRYGEVAAPAVPSAVTTSSASSTEQ